MRPLKWTTASKTPFKYCQTVIKIMVKVGIKLLKPVLYAICIRFRALCALVIPTNQSTVNLWTSTNESAPNCLFGQTVTMGKSMSEIGRVSIVVVIGLSAQLEKDCWIRTKDPVKPAMTTQIQNSLTNPLLPAI